MRFFHCQLDSANSSQQQQHTWCCFRFSAFIISPPRDKLKTASGILFAAKELNEINLLRREMHKHRLSKHFTQYQIRASPSETHI